MYYTNINLLDMAKIIQILHIAYTHNYLQWYHKRIHRNTKSGRRLLTSMNEQEAISSNLKTGPKTVNSLCSKSVPAQFAEKGSGESSALRWIDH